MKKILALILVVCLSVGCFVACGEEEPAATKKPTAAPATSAPADDDNITEESADPAETEAPATDVPTTDAPTTDEPTTDEPTTDEPAGDWEMPDNSGIDCQAFDLRGGETAHYEYADGYIYVQTAENSAHETYLEATDPEGSTPGYLTMYIEGEDPYFYFYSNEISGDAIDFALQDYPFVKIVLKNNTPGTSFEMFIWDPDNNPGANLTASHCINFDGISANDTAFKTYYLDLRASGASNDTVKVSALNGGTLDNRYVSSFRIDPPGGLEDDWSFDIQYIAFFKTLEDAQAYK